MSGPGFGGDWQGERRKQERAAKRRAAERADDARVGALEQRRFAELALAHRHEHTFFESVAARIDGGGTVSPKQAAMLLQIAVERGWSTKVSAQAVPPAKQGKLERELCDYTGDDELLLAFAERCRRGEALTNSERGKANWLLQQEGLR
jgi:hypothetical protein